MGHMKHFRQLVKELPAKKVVFAFGRYQPPTIGHGLLVAAVKHVADKQGADHVIYASATHDKKQNPLPVDRKVYYLKRMFPGTNFVAADASVRTFIEAIKQLNKKYKNLVMIAGSDRVPEYKKLLDKYNGKEFHYDTIEVISAGERDPDSEGASGMSGTKMRDAAKKGDFDSFKRGLPPTLTTVDARRLMNEIREGMGIDAVKESIELPKTDLRERYHAGEIFNLEEIVESEGIVYQIKKRGSNHLLLQDQSGNMVSKWITDVTESTKEFTLLQGLNEMKYTAADKIKVARIIAGSLGVADVDKSSNAEQLVNNALRKVRNKPMRPEYVDVLHKMLVTAKEAGIAYDEKLVPQKAQQVEEGFPFTGSQGMDDVHKPNKPYGKADAKGVERIKAAKEREKKETGMYKKQTTAQRKQTVKQYMNMLKDIGEGVKQPNGTDKVGDASAVLEVSKDTLKSYIPKAMGSKSAVDFTRGVKMAQGSGGEEELRKKSEKRSAGIHTAIKKLTKEEVELEEARGFSKPRGYSEISKDEFDKHMSARDAAEKHTGISNRADREIKTDAVTGKVTHSIHEYSSGTAVHKIPAVAKITDHVKRTAKYYKRSDVKEEVELDEGKMGELHDTISRHLDKHISDFKSGHTGMDQFGSKVLAAHKSVAKEHGLEHKHAAKMVNDYVDSKLNESLEEGKDYSVTVTHFADGKHTPHEYTVKNANDYKHAKHIAMQRHAKKIGTLKQGEQYSSSNTQVKELNKESYNEISELLEQIATAAMMNKDTTELKKKLSVARIDTKNNESDKEAEQQDKPQHTKAGHSMTAPHETDAVRKMKIRYQTEEVDLDEDQATAEYKVKTYYDNALGKTVTRKVRPHIVSFKNSKKGGEPDAKDPGEDEVREGVDGVPAGDMSAMPSGAPDVYSTNPNIIDPDAKKKLRDKKALGLKEESEENDNDEDDISDDELDDMANSVTDLEHVIDAYDDDELHIVDDNGEHVDELKEELINEVLSRMERMRAKIRFAQTKAKRERKVQIALKTQSSVKTLNKRAKRLAISMMKKRLAKKPLENLSVGEKERIEAVIAKRKKAIDRLAMRLVPRVKKIEQTRLQHKHQAQ